MAKFVLIFILYRGDAVHSIGAQDFSSIDNCQHAGRMMSALMPIGDRQKKQKLEWKCVPNSD